MIENMKYLSVSIASETRRTCFDRSSLNPRQFPIPEAAEIEC
jgi:hypothetical protein